MEAMGSVLPYRPPRAREETTAWLGMVIFLGSWAMMFAALFFAYGYVRTRGGEWPPAGVPRLPTLLPALNTLVLLASSACLQYGIASVRSGGPRLFLALVAALLLGAVFLALQLWLWNALYSGGLHANSGGSYGSVFYGLTGFHALHVLVGLFGVGLLCRRAYKGEFSPAKYLPVRLWAMYWHFVGIVWALMFVSVFLL